MSIKDDMEDVQEAVINELISDNGLNPLTVGDLQITTTKIADDAVTLPKLGSDVDLGQVNDDAVTLAKLGSDVDLGQVNDGAVTPDKLSQAYLPLTGGSVTGNMGIGTSSGGSGPQDDLHISSSLATIRLEDSDVAGGASYSLITSSSNGNIELSADPDNVRSSTDIRFNVDGSEAMRIDSSGTVHIGTTGNVFGAADTYGTNIFSSGQFNQACNDGVLQYLNIENITGTQQAFMFYATRSNVGNISFSTSGVTYNTTSDYRLKTDAQPMTGASARVQALNPVNFEWISAGTRTDGFLAHEAQEVVPESVTGTKDALDEEGNPEYQGIDQSKLVPLLTAALQEALTKIEALEVRITNLEA